jgi:hypothetical protein
MRKSFGQNCDNTVQRAKNRKSQVIYSPRAAALVKCGFPGIVRLPSDEFSSLIVCGFLQKKMCITQQAVRACR